ncbi:MAG: amino acid adenylation domain-containing protein [Deltaproteobacteria bacterium]|nr:amino acid adenylation domain-containing protein [Deltaproteobacteria bacterium]
MTSSTVPSSVTPPSAMEAVADSFAMPASFGQQRLWFLDRWQPGSQLYASGRTFRLLGELDRPALESALQALVDRHESLRTVFDEADGEAEQVIFEHRRIELEVESCAGVAIPQPPSQRLESSPIEASAGSEAEPSRDPAFWLDRNASEAFDLSRGPLFRARLLYVSPEESLLELSWHHIIGDGWSTTVLLEELSHFYGAYRQGREAQLQELPIQYADYALWQRDSLTEQRLEELLSYWRERLESAPEMIELPLDRPRPSQGNHLGATASEVLPARVAVPLKDLGRQCGATWFMTMLAAFQGLLSLDSGQKTVVVGTAIANRQQAELEGLIGFFTNTLALRGDVGEKETFRSLLEVVRRTSLEAYDHQDLPFDQLVAEVAPQRASGHNPLFQVVLTVGEDSMAPLAMEGLVSEEIEPQAALAKFDLELEVAERDGALWLNLEYQQELFDDTTAVRLLGRLQRFLAAVSEQPDRPLAALPRLGAGERHQLLHEWSTRPAILPSAQTVAGRFETQVKRRPDAIAVTDGERSWTYRQLDQAANRLARCLRRRGVGPDVVVGLHLERSLELVVGILGILKAGGAYLVLDRDLPASRLRFLREDANLRLLVTADPAAQEAGAEERGQGEIPTLSLVADRQELAAQDGGPLEPTAASENLAYLAYTSGSTGQPKGIAVPHRAVLRLVLNSDFMDFGEDQVFFQLAPVSFDASTLELWGSLLHGSRLVIPPVGALSLEELGGWLREHQVTTCWLTAGLFHQMVEERLEDLRGLRQLLAGGDVLAPHLVELARRELPNCQLINGYGPTENTTFTCCHSVPRNEPGESPVPIGRPISHTRVYVVDAHQRAVPMGVAGELLTGGAGLARGYLGRPGLTASSFVPDPFSASPGERLYRTGDRARLKADGTVSFLGRIDQQVKIRGFRIELGEVEAALGSQPQVEQGAVVAQAVGESGERQLVAYVVLHDDDRNGLVSLRESLKELLPSYAVPSRFVPLDQLPLAATGKVDRRALAKGSQLIESDSSRHLPPRTPLEEMLVDGFRSVLDQPTVGIDEDFFECGGHSLTATRLVSRLASLYDLQVALPDLFVEPTVAGLARLLEGRGTSAPLPQESWVAEERPSEVPLSFAQQRLWFLCNLEPQSPVYNVAKTFRLSQETDIRLLHHSLRRVLARHEVLRTVFPAPGGRPQQRVLPPIGDDLPEVDQSGVELPEVDLPVVDVSGLAPGGAQEETRRLANRLACHPFDPERGPLLVSAVVRLAPREQIWALAVHHIVADGWSMNILEADVAELYHAQVQGRPPALPVLPLQYADFTLRQHRWLSGEDKTRQLDFWKQRLADSSGSWEMLPDKPRPAVKSHRGRQLIRPFPRELAALAQEGGGRCGTTPFMTWLGLFATLLCRYSNQRDVVVGTPVAGRSRPEVDNLIGFFVNTLPLRLDLSGAPSLEDLLKAIRDDTLAAFAHQDLPFDNLVEELKATRDPSRSPLFDVMFVFQNLALTSGGCAAGNLLQGVDLSGDTGTAKFDLTLILSQQPEGLVGIFEYNTDLFEACTIQRFSEHLLRFAEGALEQPSQPVLEHSLVTVAQRHQLLWEWNDTSTSGAIVARPEASEVEAPLFHYRFEAWADRLPDATAVVVEDRKWSYGELDRQANRLAHRLRQAGIGPESLVGLFLDRSYEQVVSLLAVLKAGGAFLSLDPSYPAQRLAFMLEDAPLEALLTCRSLQNGLPPGSGCQLLLDGETNLLETGPAHRPAVELEAESLAYVIYTSGSTGKPKGTLVRHQGMANLAHALRISFGAEPGSQILHFASVSFDSSIFETVMALGEGATLHIPPAEGRMPGMALRQRLLEQSISHITLPPSALKVTEVMELPALQTVVVAGEDCPQQVVDAWAPGRRFFNAYGPTEASVWSTTALCHAGGTKPSIGRPIANGCVRVLDSRLRLSPLGVAGELCIAGVSLARGYSGRPALTAERFVPDPWGKRGDRLYRSGDRVLARPDGELEFLGRLDRQVKLRGFRIETGEIEATLRLLPQVVDAVVSLRQVTGEPALVAYLIGSSGKAATEGAREGDLAAAEQDIRAGLRAALPVYMVPSFFVWLEAFPLSPSGKVLLKELPDPPARRSASKAGGEAPRGGLERSLVEVWQRVLGAATIGPHDNFFDLGGHSLLLVQVEAELQALGLKVTVVDLFRFPTIRSLATHLASQNQGGGEASVPVPAAQPTPSVEHRANRASSRRRRRQRRTQQRTQQPSLGEPAHGEPAHLEPAQRPETNPGEEDP